MRWKQFFTPVKSLDAAEAREFMRRAATDSFTLLDVRQPEEYESEHIPGARLIPLPQLSERWSEIDAEKPAIVHCAIGGRSRIAAQFLAAKGFKEVFNLSGGIKAWNSEKAVGPEDLGLALFSGKESPEETLVVAYGLEEGLRRFYETMAPKVTTEKARQLFEKLSSIEVKHQDRIFNEYIRVSGTAVGRNEFTTRIVAAAMEGGLSTEEYLARYQPNLENAGDVIALAMGIEAQALDLYQRAADRAKTGEGRSVLLQIANEERAHLEQLGMLFKDLGV